jgi:GT2 family glycosyltransferase
MFPTPKVSVVVSTYARIEPFSKLITSIRAAFPKECVEIIAVSSDHPYSPKGQWMRSQPDVIVIQADIRTSQRLRSIYAYENIGLRASTGEWVFMTNDDTAFDADFYTELCKVENNYDVIVVSGHIGDVRLGCRIAAIGTIKPPGGQVRPLYLYDFTIIRKSVYDKIGPIDEKMDWFGKGFDLAMACETYPGLRIGCVPDLKINHDISDENRFPPDYRTDFSYLTRKWKDWCDRTGWEFSWEW